MRPFRILVVPAFLIVLGVAAAGFGARTRAQEVTLTCEGFAPTIVGEGRIRGTSGDDVIIGSAGPDQIDGGSGNDRICGQGGDDEIDGGSGNDRIWGEAFRDDPLVGEPGNDEIDGGSGNDLLVDPVGVGQVIDGGSGNDTIIAVGEIEGGSGNDSIRFGNAIPAGEADGGSGTDTCIDVTGTADLTSCEVLA